MATQPITRDLPLLLGSGSPRRRALLADLGISFRVKAPDVDETQRSDESAATFLERVVRDKLAAVASAGLDGTAGLLVADTIVVVDGAVLGKPLDVGDALALLRRIAGREHLVWTRYALATESEPRRALVERTVETRVRMRAASDPELARYAGSGEGLDKAGAYAAQGLGAFLIEAVVGSPTNVIGLPTCELVSDLLRVGLLSEFPVRSMSDQ